MMYRLLFVSNYFKIFLKWSFMTKFHFLLREKVKLLEFSELIWNWYKSHVSASASVLNIVIFLSWLNDATKIYKNDKAQNCIDRK